LKCDNMGSVMGCSCSDESESHDDNYRSRGGVGNGGAGQSRWASKRDGVARVYRINDECDGDGIEKLMRKLALDGSGQPIAVYSGTHGDEGITNFAEGGNDRDFHQEDMETAKEIRKEAREKGVEGLSIRCYDTSNPQQREAHFKRQEKVEGMRIIDATCYSRHHDF